MSTFNNSFDTFIPNGLIFNKNISANTLRLYAMVRNLCNSKGYCWASNAFLANELGVSTRSVTDMIKTLEKDGWIVTYTNITKKGSERHIKMPSNNFHQNIEAVEGIEAEVRGGIEAEVLEGGGSLASTIIKNNNNKNNINKEVDNFKKEKPLMKNYNVSGEVTHRNKVQHFALKLFKGFKKYYEKDSRHLDLITVKEWIDPVKQLLKLYKEEEIIKLVDFNFNNDSQYKNQILDTKDLKNKIGKLILEYKRS